MQGCKWRRGAIKTLESQKPSVGKLFSDGDVGGCTR